MSAIEWKADVRDQPCSINFSPNKNLSGLTHSLVAALEYADMARFKPLLSMIILAAWGPYLLYVWIMPLEVPGWAMAPGFRRALMLDRYFEPTIFTLLFGTGFSVIAIAGVYRLLTGTMPSRHLPDTPAQGRSSAAVLAHRRGQSVASLDREKRNRRIELERQFGRRHASLLGDDQPR